MNVLLRSVCASLLLLLAVQGTAQAADIDLDYQRLTSVLDRLAADPVLGSYAPGEQSRARDSLEQLRRASDRQRAHWLYLADHRVDLAWAAARLGHAQYQLEQLRQEHSRILLEASRAEAERTRHELERQRIQALAAAEAATRLRAEGAQYAEQAETARAAAEQAQALAEARSREAALSRKEAELASAAAMALRASLSQARPVPGPDGMQMTIGDIAFESGAANLQPEARKYLGKLVQFANSDAGKQIVIRGYTDSTGAAATNQKLSLARAQSVRDALVAAGVDASRIRLEGLGEAQPVASNGTAAGRAQNRRVVVVLLD